MKTAQMRTEFSKKIDGLDDERPQEIYGVVKHRLNEENDWDEPISLSEIDKAIAQIERGEVYALDEVLNEVRAKYGLNA